MHDICTHTGHATHDTCTHTGSNTAEGSEGITHKRCRVAYNTAHAEQCIVCHQPIRERNFYNVDGGKCHMEPLPCSAQYQDMQTEACVVCGEKVGQPPCTLQGPRGPTLVISPAFQPSPIAPPA